MSDYLVDTNVISELAPGRASASEALRDWIRAHERGLFISVVTVIEIRSGVLKLERLAPGARQQALAAWADQVDRSFASRVLPVTREVAGCAALITDRNLARGLAVDWPDVVIAATAEAHGMKLLTRNVRHFTASDVAVINPFDELPEGAP